MERFITLDNCKVSNRGNVQNTKILKKQINRSGYEMVRLKVDKKKYRWIAVHRLVAQAFIPNPDNKPHVNHKDGNKKNNHVDNLEWTTRSENSKHAYNIGLQSNTSQYKSIKKIDIDTGEVLKVYNSISEACKELGANVWNEVRIKTGNISACAKGKKKTAYGYKWRYVHD